MVPYIHTFKNAGNDTLKLVFLSDSSRSYHIK